ncbi:MAG: PEP-CTERM sorting domain-containing protein [Opitutales bacterium]
MNIGRYPTAIRRALLAAGLILAAAPALAQTTSTWAGDSSPYTPLATGFFAPSQWVDNWVSQFGAQGAFDNNLVFPASATGKEVTFNHQFGTKVGPLITIADGYDFNPGWEDRGWLMPSTGGTIEFSGSSTFDLIVRTDGGSGVATFRQTDAGTLSLGSGSPGWPGIAFNNGFIFDADHASAQIDISEDDGAHFRSTQQLQFTGAGTTRIVSGGVLLAPTTTATNQGVRLNGGNLVVEGQLQNNGANAAVVSVYNGGKLMGNGLVTSDGTAFIGRFDGTDTAGTLAPGSAAGSIDTLTFQQDVTFSSTGVFEADLGSGGTSDLLDLTGFDLILDTGSTLALSGTLETGQTYTLAQFSSVGGTASQFSTVTLNGNPLTGGTLDYTSGSLTLMAAPIPEPAAIGLILGLAGLGFARRHRNRRAATPSAG